MNKEFKFEVKYGIGDLVFIAKDQHPKLMCICCNGYGTIINQSTNEVECHLCNGRGYVLDKKNKEKTPIDKQFIVEGVTIKIMDNCLAPDGKDISLKYNLIDTDGKMRSVKKGDEVFGTIEEVIKYCEDCNVKEVQLEDIIISEGFKTSNPSSEKIKKKLDLYNQNGEFDKCVVIDKNNVLVDGYITYLIAKMFDIKTLKCKIR